MWTSYDNVYPNLITTLRFLKSSRISISLLSTSLKTRVPKISVSKLFLDKTKSIIVSSGRSNFAPFFVDNDEFKWNFKHKFSKMESSLLNTLRGQWVPWYQIMENKFEYLSDRGGHCGHLSEKF